MGTYFGTDGFRGEVNRILTTEHAFAVGRFLGAHFQESGHPRVLVGKDTRRSSYTLEYALAAGLTASGADAHLLHVIPTPGVAFLTQRGGFDCGIMISASHNSFEDNGIKLFDRRGEKMDDAVITLLERYLDQALPLPHATGEHIGVVVDDSMARDRYVDQLLSFSEFSLQGLRIGLDVANGSAHRIAPRVLRTLGASVFVVHNDPDGCNINRECGSTHVADLQRLVIEKSLDVGFALDGDADRCIAVDHLGRVIDGDGILYVMGGYFKEQGRLKGQTVVTTVMSNEGLRHALDERGILCEVTAVGDRFVHDRMQKNGYVLGGEPSGHVILGEYCPTGDGILTAMKLAERLVDTGHTLGELTAGYHPYPQLLTNVSVSDPKKAVCDPRVAAAVSLVQTQLAGRGRALVRASGTEPVVRILIEADDPALCKTHAAVIIAALKECF